jgi:hypothetical protein
VAVKAAHFARPPGLGLDGREHGDNIRVRRGSEYSIRKRFRTLTKTRRINGLLQSLHSVFDSKDQYPPVRPRAIARGVFPESRLEYAAVNGDDAVLRPSTTENHHG